MQFNVGDIVQSIDHDPVGVLPKGSVGTICLTRIAKDGTRWVGVKWDDFVRGHALEGRLSGIERFSGWLVPISIIDLVEEENE